MTLEPKTARYYSTPDEPRQSLLTAEGVGLILLWAIVLLGLPLVFLFLFMAVQMLWGEGTVTLP